MENILLLIIILQTFYLMWMRVNIGTLETRTDILELRANGNEAVVNFIVENLGEVNDEIKSPRPCEEPGSKEV